MWRSNLRERVEVRSNRSAEIKMDYAKTTVLKEILLA
jgi:hypothetical protein